MRPRVSLATVCLNCADAHELGRFWSAFLGWPITRTEPHWVLLRDPEGHTGISCQAEADYVPPVWPAAAGEPQMQMHLDLLVDDLEAAVAHAVACGARLARWQPQAGVRVLIDPAGHPFCCFED
ncbi:VOC family protein [Nocardioides limicola]|uniref:VOC family protein n=1 Tax=Nocardioides limicola TaxID=2803368 RepID=UPI00193B5656|nr:VOC family protein [Nocardioides sp. DJM-14]